MIKLFSAGETEFRISPAVMLLIPAAAALCGIRMTVVALISLSLHEAAHAMTSKRLGYPVKSVEVQPFGFVAKLDTDAVSFRDAAAIYAAGPTASISLAAFSSLLEGLIPRYAQMKAGFTEYNLLIALVNLIPALPLDGGRLVYAAFSGRGRKTASAVLRALGLTAGAAFTAAFLLLIRFGAFNPTFLIMGIFLMIAAASDRERSAAGAARKRIKKGAAIPVRNIAVASETRLSSAIELMPAGGYAVLSVVEGGKRIAELDEARVLEAASILGAGASLADAVALFGQKMV